MFNALRNTLLPSLRSASPCEFVGRGGVSNYFTRNSSIMSNFKTSINYNKSPLSLMSGGVREKSCLKTNKSASKRFIVRGNGRIKRPHRKEQVVDVSDVAKRLGVRLTPCETELLRKKLDFNSNGIITYNDFKLASQRTLEDRTIREICLQVIEQPTNTVSKAGTHFVRLMDYVGLALFSVVGTQVAGDAGFNLVGCTMVGCVAGLGGRTINNLLFGATRNGVFWARNSLYLAVAIGSSVLTFFTWPIYCDHMSKYYLEQVIGKERLEEDGSVNKDEFVNVCEHDHEFLATIRNIMLPKSNDNEELTAGELFHLIDLDSSGTIDSDELKFLVQEHIRNSWVMYTIDTVALAAISVAGVHGAIALGLHPIVAATSGVTMSLGGVLRDVFVGKDLAVASQSYAMATGAGSTVYVLTRELALRGYPLLAIVRIMLSMGTTISLRYWEYIRGQPLLAPMHGRKMI